MQKDNDFGEELARIMESGVLIGTGIFTAGEALKLAKNYAKVLKHKKILKEPKLTKSGKITWD